jgi:hypothetical protein
VRILAGPEGFEPPTIGFGVRRSTYWSYGPVHSLPGFPVGRVSTAEPAILPKFKSPGMRLLVLHCRVIALLAFLASQGHDLCSSFSHVLPLPSRKKHLQTSLAQALVQCQFSIFASGTAETLVTDQNGARNQNRTGDLILTKDALCRLSYASTTKMALVAGAGFEPATSGL